MGHGVFGMEEVDAPLFPPLFEPALSQTKCVVPHSILLPTNLEL